MTATTMTGDSPISSEPQSATPHWKRFVDYLVERRVRISLLVFSILLVEDVWSGVKPHDLTDIYDAKAMIGFGLVVAGLALRSWAAGTLQKNARLTTSGPYSIIRNPLYVGSFLIMLGFCTVIDDAENIWFVLGPFAVLYVFKVLGEERHLSEMFGDQWQEYVLKVPRFFPRRLPSDGFAHWNLSQWLGNREYRALSAVLLGLVAVETWHLL